VLGRVDKHDALQIPLRYLGKYNRDLCRVLGDEVGGNFGKALHAWITLRDPTDDLEHHASLINPTSPQVMQLAKNITENAKV
jgi:hypothetical protein